MKWLVNGVETDLPNQPEGVELRRVGERLYVTSQGKTKSAMVVRDGDRVLISYGAAQYVLKRPSSAREEPAAAGDARAPMPGQVVEVYVEEGEQVKAGQRLLVIEAMKMQHPILAPYDGSVTKLPFAAGDQVSEGDLLVHVEPCE